MPSEAMKRSFPGTGLTSVCVPSPRVGPRARPSFFSSPARPVVFGPARPGFQVRERVISEYFRR